MEKHESVNLSRGERLTIGMRRPPAFESRVTNIDLAKALDVSPSRVSQFRKGEEMSATHAVKCSKYLGISINWLLTGEGYMVEDESYLNLQRCEYEIIEALRMQPINISNEIMALVRKLVRTA